MALELLFNENPNKFKKGCKHALNGDVLTSEQQSHITGGKWWGGEWTKSNFNHFDYRLVEDTCKSLFIALLRATAYLKL